MSQKTKKIIPLDKPLTIKQVQQRAKDDEFLTVVVKVDLSDVIDKLEEKSSLRRNCW